MKELLEEIIVGIVALSIAAVILSIVLIITLLFLPIKVLERTGKWIQKIMTS
jgi:hypothetical protein